MRGIFSFSKDSPRVDEHAAQPGAANAAPDSGSIASATASAAREAATKEAAVSPRKRRTSRASADAGGVDSADLQNQVNGEIARQLDALHEPEQWSALLCMPADAAKTWTGRDHWELAKEERKTLGMTGSAFARTMMITNPRALAMLMLASAVFSAYVPRSLKQMQIMREEMDKKAKANEPKPGVSS